MRKITVIINLLIVIIFFLTEIAFSWSENDEIFLAACSGNLGRVESLLRENPDLINKKDQYDYTLLHFACSEDRNHENKDTAEFLILEGADVNAKSKSGNTPLHVAAETGLNEIVGLLLDHSADVNARNNSGETPLDVALKEKYNNTEGVVKILLSHGADINLATLKKFCEEKKYDNIKLYLVNNWKPKVFLLIIILFVISLFLFKMKFSKHGSIKLKV